MVSGYEIDMCFYIVSIVESFQGMVSLKKKISLILRKQACWKLFKNCVSKRLQVFFNQMN